MEWWGWGLDGEQRRERGVERHFAFLRLLPLTLLLTLLLSMPGMTAVRELEVCRVLCLFHASARGKGPDQEGRLLSRSVCVLCLKCAVSS